MTLPFSRDEVCAVCGAASEQTGVLSTSTFGPPDLDGRPAPLKRATIEWAIHRCPNCGYCSPNLGDAAEHAAKVVRSTTYQEQLSDQTVPELARWFLCAALVAEKGEGAAASHARALHLLHAAWACDDADAVEVAGRCRLQAAAAGEAAITAGESLSDQDPAGDHAFLADLYRRAGRFDEAGAAARAGLDLADADLFRDLLGLQLMLVEARDASVHTCDELPGGDPE